MRRLIPSRNQLRGPLLVHVHIREVIMLLDNGGVREITGAGGAARAPRRPVNDSARGFSVRRNGWWRSVSIMTLAMKRIGLGPLSRFALCCRPSASLEEAIAGARATQVENA